MKEQNNEKMKSHTKDVENPVWCMGFFDEMLVLGVELLNNVDLRGSMCLFYDRLHKEQREAYYVQSYMPMWKPIPFQEAVYKYKFL